ncbi:hypothetical protein GCWU000324_03168 [Kingella oralis ATCC 51147]|uniref:Uncharacterized protein n=1 Tax=Kingella oralis ATCC 51147 TaxID=629741 RepID=C4GN78_9NEIS|nr:hypothetical protein GCWU000324_03168 [Kingella oralis ATCC 51147]
MGETYWFVLFWWFVVFRNIHILEAFTAFSFDINQVNKSL